MCERGQEINTSSFSLSKTLRKCIQTSSKSKELLFAIYFPIPSTYHLFQLHLDHSFVMSSLLEPVVVGGKLSLRNRVVMGSMTRNRCVDNSKPGPAHIKHYADRARDGVGLIVNEGTFVDWTGCDWDRSPVMINGDHAHAWRLVTDAVHHEGGTIYFQAWHAGKADPRAVPTLGSAPLLISFLAYVGRCQHDQMPIMKEKGRVVEAPSAIRANDGKYRQLPGMPVRSH